MHTIDPSTIAQLLRDSMAKGKQPKLTIISASMEPLLRVDDHVQIVPANSESLRKGDIVVLRAPNAIYTHRYCGTVQHEGKTYLVTRGDRPMSYDPPWSPDDLIGRVVARVRNGRSLTLSHGKAGLLLSLLAVLVSLEEKIFTSRNHPITWQTLSQPETRLIGKQWRVGWRKPLFYALRGKFLIWYRLLNWFAGNGKVSQIVQTEV